MKVIAIELNDDVYETLKNIMAHYDKNENEVIESAIGCLHAFYMGALDFTGE